MSQTLIAGAATICGFIEDVKRGVIQSLCNDQQIMSQRQLRDPYTIAVVTLTLLRSSCQDCLRLRNSQIPDGSFRGIFGIQPFQALDPTIPGPYGHTLNVLELHLRAPLLDLGVSNHLPIRPVLVRTITLGTTSMGVEMWSGIRVFVPLTRPEYLCI